MNVKDLNGNIELKSDAEMASMAKHKIEDRTKKQQELIKSMWDFIVKLKKGYEKNNQKLDYESYAKAYEKLAGISPEDAWAKVGKNSDDRDHKESALWTFNKGMKIK